jgi:MFS family permease
MMWGIGASCFAYAFFHRVLPSVMVSELMRDFSVGGAILGNLSALYFYIYAGMQIPIGMAIDRWGTRYVLASAVSIAALGSLLFAFAPSLEVAYLGRLAIGLGSAVGFVGTLALIAAWFPHNRFAFMSGMTMLVAMAGGVLGQAPMAPVVEAIGWRNTLLVAGAYAVLLALVIWLVVRDRPAGVPAPPKAAGGLRGLGRDLRQVASNPQYWILAAYGCAMSGPMLSYAVLWGVPHMTTKFGIERPLAALSASILLIGWAMGSPLSGWLSDHIGRRKLPCILAAAIQVVLWPIILYADMPLFLVWGLLFVAGLVGSTMIVCFAAAREISPLHMRGAATAFVNCFSVAAGALMQPAIGWLLDRNWDGVMVDGARVYSAATFDAALLSLPILVGIAFLLSFLIRETWCRPLGGVKSAAGAC